MDIYKKRAQDRFPDAARKGIPSRDRWRIVVTFDDPSLFESAGAKLLPHLTHKLTITAYGGDVAPDNIAIECEECAEILIDFLPEASIPNGDTGEVATENPIHTRDSWRSEVANQDTQLGYWHWVAHKGEEDNSECGAQSNSPA